MTCSGDKQPSKTGSMQTLRLFLLLVGSLVTTAQTPTFGTQYTGDVCVMLLKVVDACKS